MNFKEYIDKDIADKKFLLDLLPMNTEARVKKYKETVTEIINHYQPTIENTKKYIDYKYSKLYPVQIDRSEEIGILDQQIEVYKNILTITNHTSSFYERLGFDLLMFDLEHYYNNTLEKNNEIIMQIISRFTLANINISENDFKLNVFSYNYMIYIFKMLKNESIDIEILKKLFWKCPNIYVNIIVSFKVLIDKNEKKLIRFTNDYETKLLKTNGFASKEELIKKLYELEEAKKQLQEKDEADMIMDFMNDNMDFGMYKDSLDNVYGELDFFLINPIDTTNPEVLNQTLQIIAGFHKNLLEYGNYSRNIELFENIKNTYTKTIAVIDNKQLVKDIKLQKKTISKLYSKLKKMFINKEINLANFDQSLTPNEMNQALEQQKQLSELYKEYIKYDSLYFNSILKKYINDNSFISDILNIIISYPFFSRSIIKTVFEYEESDEVTKKYKELFDMYYNSNRKLIDMKSAFSKENFEIRLMDAYRFDNLNINETSFEEDSQNLIFTNYEKLQNKIKISKFTHTPEEIEFLINIKKMKDEEIKDE